MDIKQEAPEGEAYYRLCYRDYQAQNPPRKLDYYRDIAIRFAPRKPDIRSLDIGCAFGDFLAALPSSWSKTGIDSNGFAIATAAKRHPGVTFLQTETLNFPNMGFDIITAFDVLEHIENLEAALETIRSALRPDGIFVLVVPVYDGPLGAIVGMLDRDPTHVHKDSRTFWIRAVERSFQILHYEGTFRFLIPRTRYYLHAHSSALAFLSPAIIIVARHPH